MSFLDMFTERAIETFLGDAEHSQPNFCHYVSAGEDSHSMLSYDKLPEKGANTMRLIIVSDTHERHTKLRNLPKGDVFVHCGDVLMTSRLYSVGSGIRKLYCFNEWMKEVPCLHKLVIAGNHDGVMEKIGKEAVQGILTNAIYLENDLIEIDKIKIWGTPFSAGRSVNKAFQSDKFKSTAVTNAPNYDVDILLTHGHCPELEEKVSHSVHLWGHNHNSYGIRYPPMQIRGKPVLSLSICVPIMDKSFRPVQLPVVLDIRVPPKDVTGYEGYDPVIRKSLTMETSSPASEQLDESPPLNTPIKAAPTPLTTIKSGKIFPRSDY